MAALALLYLHYLLRGHRRWPDERERTSRQLNEPAWLWIVHLILTIVAIAVAVAAWRCP